MRRVDAFVVDATDSLLNVKACLQVERFSHPSDEFSISWLILFLFPLGVGFAFLFRRTREVLA